MKTKKPKSSNMKIYCNIFFLLTVTFFCAKAQSLEELLIWKFETGPINSNPLIYDSIVYFGSMDSCFYAVDFNTGKEIWKNKLPYPITSGTGVFQNIVCVRLGNTLFGFNKNNGDLVWKYRYVKNEPSVGQPTVFNHSSPVVYKEVVYFGDELGNINGVNVFTGELVFNFNPDKDYSRTSDHIIRSTPVIENGIIYFGDNGANMYAVSLSDGTLIWIHKVESPRWDGSVISEVVLNDSVLYYGGYNNTFSPLNKYTGNPIWKFTDENTFLPSTPVIYQDKVIVGATIDSEKIHALSISTGKEVWTFQAEGIFFVTPQIIKDSILLVSSANPFADKVGYIYLINCNNGKLLHKIQLNGSTETSPACIGNSLLIGKDDGLYLINILNKDRTR